MLEKIIQFEKEIQSELLINYKPVHKDILIVVHNQLDYVKACIESIYEYTEDFTLYLWDNNSDQETAEYLAGLGAIRSEVNLGFIEPNNELVKLGNSEYIILLNSDTIVKAGWDKYLIGFLQNNPEFGQVGYSGSKLENGKGGKTELITPDYIPGWCFCIPRKIYNEIGLFDPNFKFAYCEDADLSFRIKERWKIHSLKLDLVYHFQNKTIKEVAKKQDCRKTFDQNHEYLQKKWKIHNFI